MNFFGKKAAFLVLMYQTLLLFGFILQHEAFASHKDTVYHDMTFDYARYDFTNDIFTVSKVHKEPWYLREAYELFQPKLRSFIEAIENNIDEADSWNTQTLSLHAYSVLASMYAMVYAMEKITSSTASEFSHRRQDNEVNRRPSLESLACFLGENDRARMDGRMWAYVERSYNEMMQTHQGPASAAARALMEAESDKIIKELSWEQHFRLSEKAVLFYFLANFDVIAETAYTSALTYTLEHFNEDKNIFRSPEAWLAFKHRAFRANAYATLHGSGFSPYVRHWFEELDGLVGEILCL